MASKKEFFTVKVTVEVKQSRYLGEGAVALQLQEAVQIEVRDFPGVAHVLKEFHRAYVTLRKLGIEPEE